MNVTSVMEDVVDGGSSVNTSSSVAVLDTFLFYYEPLMVLVGCVTNTATSTTLLYTRLRKHPASHALAAKFLADTTVLLHVGALWLGRAGVPVQTGASCPYVWFMSQCGTFLSVWLLVLACLERHVSLRGGCGGSLTWYTTTRQSRDTAAGGGRPHMDVFNMQVAIITALIVSVVVYINMSQIIGGVVRDDNTTMCAPLVDYMDTFRLLNKFDLALNAILPYVITLVFTVWTMRLVYAQQAMRRSTITGCGMLERRLWRRSEVDVSRLVTRVCLVTLVVTGPTQCLRTVQDARDSLAPGLTTPSTLYLLIQRALLVLFRSSYAMNFFVVWASHGEFRRALQAMVWSVAYRARSWCGGAGRRSQRAVSARSFQFTVDFSSTLIRLRDTTLN